MTQTTQEVGSAIEVLTDLLEDQGMPRNIRTTMQEVITVLQRQTDQSVCIHEALNLLENVSNDANLESFTRMQVYSLVSMLENLK